MLLVCWNMLFIYLLSFCLDYLELVFVCNFYIFFIMLKRFLCLFLVNVDTRDCLISNFWNNLKWVKLGNWHLTVFMVIFLNFVVFIVFYSIKHINVDTMIHKKENFEWQILITIASIDILLHKFNWSAAMCFQILPNN